MRGLHSSCGARVFACASLVSIASFVSGALVGGCASGALAGARRAAERGDLASLRAEIVSREARGSLTNADAASLGRAVAAHEIRVAPPQEARARVSEVRSCAADLDDVLTARMKVHDAAGAEAALVLLDAGRLDAGDARRSASDADDAWRAFGARGLTRAEDTPARQHALLDPSPEVRRAAARASADAKAAEDFDVLAETARVDPDPLTRTHAARALAQIGGARAVAKLRDLWVNADDPLREDIARAWSSEALFAAGGREELRVLLGQGRGSAAIDGAAALLGRTWQKSQGDAALAELKVSARALLSRAIESGSERDRLHAIAVAPLDAGVIASLRTAAKDGDVQVALSARARLTESAPDRAASVEGLEALARDENRIAVASRARLALASAGDLRVQALLESDLASKEASARLSAADALAALGRSARAAPLLADADAGVRVRAACTLMTGARHRH